MEGHGEKQGIVAIVKDNDDNSGYKSIGTGFFACDSSVIFTCKHILPNAKFGDAVYCLFQDEKKPFTAIVQKVITDIDIVVLKSSRKSDVFYSLSEGRIGESYSTYGFPEGELIQVEGKPTYDFLADQTNIQLGNSGNIVPGFSGAPLLDKTRNVVGIIYSVPPIRKSGSMLELCHAIPTQSILEALSDYTGGYRSSIVFISTHWGYRTGGINSINIDLCKSVAQEIDEKLYQVICVVPNASQETINSAKKSRINLISLYQTEQEFDANSMTKVLEKLSINPNSSFFIIGHDTITGNYAIQLKNLIAQRNAAVKLAIIHHMDYNAHGSKKYTATEIQSQKQILRCADVVFAIGLALTNSANKKRGKADSVMIIPGLIEEELGVDGQ